MLCCKVALCSISTSSADSAVALFGPALVYSMYIAAATGSYDCTDYEPLLWFLVFQASSRGNVGVLFHINSSDSEKAFFTRKFLKSYVPLVHAYYYHKWVSSFVCDVTNVKLQRKKLHLFAWCLPLSQWLLTFPAPGLIFLTILWLGDPSSAVVCF